MKKWITIILSTFLTFIITTPVVADETITNPHVLFLSSYNYRFESNPLQLDGITDVLSGKANIDYVFMNTKELDYEEVIERVHEDVIRISNYSKLDYVIAADDAALHFAIDYQDELFSDTDIIFEGINDVDFAKEAAKDPHITGVIETFPIKETIEVAKKLNPTATTVTAIMDNTISGLGSTKQFMDCKNAFPELSFTTINSSELTKNELINAIKKCGDNTILLYLLCTSDADGNKYTADEGVKLVYDNASVPIFKADELGMNEGVTGGVMISYHDMAADAANIVLSLAGGSNISDFPVSTTKTFANFDIQVMKKFKITKTEVIKAFGPNATFINEDPSFYEEHRQVLIPSITISTLLIIFLIAMLMAAKKNRKTMWKMLDREKMLNNLLNNMPGGMVVYKFRKPDFTKSEIRYFSRGVPKLSERTDEEFKEWTKDETFICFKDMENYHEILAELHKDVSNKMPFSFSYHRVNPDGKVVRISIGASWAYDDVNGNRTYYAVFMNESLQEQVIIAEQEAFKAKAADNAKSEFLSNMSHDMRTPVSTILGITELALSDGTTKEEMTDSLHKIQYISEYLIGIVNDILNMSRIERGKFTVNYEWTSLAEVLQRSVDLIRPEMEKKKINFVYPDFSRLNQVEFYIDVLKTQRMLVNILSNACKFTDIGGNVTLSAKNIKHDDTTSTDQLMIEDNGCGMSKEFLKEIFTPFAQEKTKNSGQNPGTGLGLVIAKHYSQAMGGDIEVESELGKGTKFTITQSYRYRYKNQNNQETEKIHDYDSSFLVGKHILVCEDSKILSEIERKQLEMKNCNADVAENGRIGLEMFLRSEEGHYDAILMDIRMPEMGGLEATKLIRHSGRIDAKDIPIIAMSANAYQEDIDKSLEAGMNAHLAKPVPVEVMFSTLVKYIRNREKNDISNKEAF